MKIFTDASVSVSRVVSEIEHLWSQTALQISMEYGIHVLAKVEWDSNGNPRHILFHANGHKFEGLNDLKRALDNPAFL